MKFSDFLRTSLTAIADQSNLNQVAKRAGELSSKIFEILDAHNVDPVAIAAAQRVILGREKADAIPQLPKSPPRPALPTASGED